MKFFCRLLSLFIILSVFSCKTEKDCPAFETNDLKYFAYHAGDTLRFTNAASEIFEIYIEQIKTSDSYSFECNDLYGICPCINYAEAIATDNRSSDSYILLKMEQSDVSEMQIYRYRIMDYSFEFDFKNELPYIAEMEHLTFLGNFSVGGKIYENVVKISDLGNSSEMVEAVFFNQKNGLLRVDEKSPDSIWEIVY
jgi:hypothetical protein